MKQIHEIRRDFLREIHPRNRGFRPLRAALILAQAEEPRLDPESADRILRSWEKKVGARIDAEGELYHKIKAFNKFFYGELGFQGPPSGSADSAFLHPHRVIAGRSGWTVSLALIYQDLASRRGIPVKPTAFPGQIFFSSPWLGEGLYIDPLDGAILGVDETRERVGKHFRAGDLRFRPELITPLTGRQLFERYMVTLKGIYLSGHLYLEALRVADWRLRLSPKSQSARWERGLILYELNRFEEARRDLSRLIPRGQISRRATRNVNRAMVCSLLATLERAFRST
jgi:regulator of sirC expression with transglutaminase-like and TPR domain